MTTAGSARAGHYREQLRDILVRKQPNAVHLLVNRWCSNVLRSKNVIDEGRQCDAAAQGGRPTRQALIDRSAVAQESVDLLAARRS